MDTPEVKLLNPIGGYSKLKRHLQVAHNIDTSNMSKFTALNALIADRVIYDYLRDEMR